MSADCGHVLYRPACDGCEARYQDRTSAGELAEPAEVHHEEWRPIPFAPEYMVSNLGRVRSMKQHHGPGGYLMTNVLHSTGYYLVKLQVPGVGPKEWRVHRLVLAAFVGPLPEGMQSRHIDGNPLNNRLDNLQYGTGSENTRDQVRHGTHNCSSRTHCPKGHEYTPENTRYRTSRAGNPSRVCVKCSRIRDRETYPRRKARRQAARAARLLEPRP